MFGRKNTATAARPTTGPDTPPAERPPPGHAAPPRAGPPNAARERADQFNELKKRLHRKLVEQLDLTRMTGDDDTLREQVREVVVHLCEQENTLLNYN
ncbi:MAG: hypothetical protein ACYSVY_26485, partial [Planctomycetota bacterium]